ncbi:hydantoinase/oxoprolinase family protein [Brucella grignonensis]|uniref:hydantoinase/oxoprolinase family protein n=1 Tax=Brucella grignonensis TaxID=94627 RepID=UPI0035BC4901
MSNSRSIATDVGGTFTDLVGIELDGDKRRIITAKADSTPPNFEEGVLEAIRKSGVSEGEITSLAHGSTVIINALTERKGAKVGLITTAGFRDVLEIARGDRPNYFDMFYRKPTPFVPRHLSRELTERVDYKGNVVTPVSLDGLDDILSDFRQEAVEAIAVSFLHSYTHPDHEAEVARAIRERAPDFFVSCANEISREWREYERTNTAVLSAYVKPVADKYLKNLKSSLADRGYSKPIYVMQSNCGISTFDRALEMPISMVESGPSSGILGAAKVGKLIGEPNVIALDIGGTTAKCSLIENGEVTVSSDYWIERTRTGSGYPIMVPVVDIVEIGNGGGSIAWVDEYDKMHVGPKSAGANPGPVAYGRGGTSPTTTDANLYLGRIDADYFCGGEVVADMDALQTALTTLGERLDLSPVEAARGIVRIANHNMTNALKLISLNRGHDPRDFTLMAFGGGGGMHATALARDLGVSRVVIPVNAAVFSAMGMLLSDLRRDYIETLLMPFHSGAIEKLNEKIADVEGRARAEFKADGVDPDKVEMQHFARLRYQNQEHFVEVRIPEKFDKATLEEVRQVFHETYEREYTYRLDSPIEHVALHCVAVSKKSEDVFDIETGFAASRPEPLTKREVDFDLHGSHQTSIYRGEQLAAGAELTGPAIIEEKGTTIVVYPGDAVRKDGVGNYIIEIGAEDVQ